MAKWLPILLSIFVLTIVPVSVYAAPSIELDSYENSIKSTDSILVFGKVTGATKWVPIQLTVTDPDGMVLYTPPLKFDDDGNFKTMIKPPIPSFKEGIYTVVASHQDLDQKAVLKFTVIATELPRKQAAPTSPQEEDEIESKPTGQTRVGLQMTAKAVVGTTTVYVSGTTDTFSDITLKVVAPNGNLVAIDQITPVNGEFSTELKTTGPLWSQDGIYRVSVHQGYNAEKMAEIDVDIEDGIIVPEFGSIVMIVMFVAISAAVIFSTKYSKVIPKA